MEKPTHKIIKIEKNFYYGIGDKMNKKLTLIVCASLFLVSAGAMVYATTSSEQDEKQQVAYPPTKVALATVQSSKLPNNMQGVGELEAARQVYLAAETNGRIATINFESGQVVKTGQGLVKLNDEPEQAELLRLQAQLTNAEKLYSRTRQLYSKNVAAAAQLDSTLSERDMIAASIREVKARIAQKTIKAPFDGIVGIRLVHEGQYLNAGERVASLVDASHLKLNFSLDEQVAPKISTKQPIRIEVDAYPDRVFTGSINAIDPLIGSSRTVQVQAVLPNKDNQLKAGMFARVQVTSPNSPSVLTVPETAVTYTAYGDTVFVAQFDNQKNLIAKRVSVKVGLRYNNMIEIKEGLSLGDQVVSSGQIKLSDGMTIEPIELDTLTLAQSISTKP